MSNISPSLSQSGHNNKPHPHLVHVNKGRYVLIMPGMGDAVKPIEQTKDGHGDWLH